MRKQATSILLDVDGTLWDTTGVVAEAWNEAVRQEGYPPRGITARQLSGLFGKTMDVIAEELFPDLSPAQKTSLLARCCQLEHEALTANQQDLLYPQVAETMRILSKTRPLFIVSNCQKGYIELFLEKTGLGDTVTDFECYGNTGQGKAHNIRLVTERNHLDSPVYLGDTMGDYQAATEAGVPFLHAAYGFGTVPAGVPAIASFAQLLER